MTYTEQTYTTQLAKLLETDPSRVTFTSPASGSFSINVLNPYGKPDLVASFHLREAPGCCGLIFSYGAQVVEIYRNRGIGALVSRMRRKIAYELGYSAIICTDISTNFHQAKILASQDWSRVFGFQNRRNQERPLRPHAVAGGRPCGIWAVLHWLRGLDHPAQVGLHASNSTPDPCGSWA